MLSGSKLKQVSADRNVSVEQLAGYVAYGSRSQDKAASAVKNWIKGLYKPLPTAEDVKRLGRGLGVEETEISEWRVSYRWAPSSPRKARLITELISGRNAQEALDILKFEHKRVARMVEKLLSSAISNADEQEADVDNLVVVEARVDGAGRRLGTKGWIAKDRGRAHPIKKQASHIHVTVAQG